MIDAPTLRKRGSRHYQGVSLSRRRLLQSNMRIKIIEMAAAGVTEPEIAEAVGRSLRHVQNIIRKDWGRDPK